MRHSVGPQMSSNMEKALEIGAYDRRITTVLLSIKLDIGKEMSRAFLERELHKEKKCGYVPHSLTKKHKQYRAACCCNFLDAADHDHDVFHRIVTGENRRCFQFEQETKRYSIH